MNRLWWQTIVQVWKMLGCRTMVPLWHIPWCYYSKGKPICRCKSWMSWIFTLHTDALKCIEMEYLWHWYGVLPWIYHVLKIKHSQGKVSQIHPWSIYVILVDSDCDWKQECSVNGTCLILCTNSEDCAYGQYCDDGYCIGDPDLIGSLVPGSCKTTSDCGEWTFNLNSFDCGFWFLAHCTQPP